MTKYWYSLSEVFFYLCTAMKLGVFAVGVVDREPQTNWPYNLKWHMLYISIHVIDFHVPLLYNWAVEGQGAPTHGLLANSPMSELPLPLRRPGMSDRTVLRITAAARSRPKNPVSVEHYALRRLFLRKGKYRWGGIKSTDSSKDKSGRSVETRERKKPQHWSCQHQARILARFFITCCIFQMFFFFTCCKNLK